MRQQVAARPRSACASSTSASRRADRCCRRVRPAALEQSRSSAHAVRLSRGRSVTLPDSAMWSHYDRIEAAAARRQRQRAAGGGERSCFARRCSNACRSRWWRCCALELPNFYWIASGHTLSFGMPTDTDYWLLASLASAVELWFIVSAMMLRQRALRQRRDHRSRGPSWRPRAASPAGHAAELDPGAAEPVRRLHAAGFARAYSCWCATWCCCRCCCSSSSIRTRRCCAACS